MFDKFFELTKRNTNLKIELIAGLTTFLSVCYIIFVNPQMLSEAGIDYQTVFIATILASSVGCLLCGLWARMPIAIAPGMGINAFFAYTICMGMNFSASAALLATTISGLIIIIISVTKIRTQIVTCIPRVLKNSITVALGFFITMVGLKNAGVIISNPSTLLSLGDVHNPSIVLTIIGVFIAIFFAIRKNNLGLFYTMLICIIMALVTQYGLGINLGLEPIQGIISIPTNIQFGFKDLDIIATLSDFKFWIIIISLVFINFFDSTGVLLGIGTKSGLVDNTGSIINEKQIMTSNGISTMLSGILGTSPTVSYMESMSGVAVGGRTGIVAIVVGICFLLSALFFPVISYFIPIMSIITTPVLVLVGIMMMENITSIDFTKLINNATCFITIIVTIGAYSIASGIGAGLLTYIFCNLVSKEEKLPISTYILGFVFILYFVLI